ncbi:MAG: hypothetical protein V7K56_16220 [Nostoc sp.]
MQQFAPRSEGYQPLRGSQKEPVRWAGSPTCSLLAFPQGSNWRSKVKSQN